MADDSRFLGWFNRKRPGGDGHTQLAGQFAREAADGRKPAATHYYPVKAEISTTLTRARIWIKGRDSKRKLAFQLQPEQQEASFFVQMFSHLDKTVSFVEVATDRVVLEDIEL